MAGEAAGGGKNAVDAAGDKLLGSDEEPAE
jgi:hypothetical protein